MSSMIQHIRSLIHRQEAQPVFNYADNYYGDQACIRQQKTAL